MERPFTENEVVELLDTETNLEDNIAGKTGVLVDNGKRSDGQWKYQVYVYDRKKTFTVSEYDIDSTGEEDLETPVMLAEEKLTKKTAKKEIVREYGEKRSASKGDDDDDDAEPEPEEAEIEDDIDLDFDDDDVELEDEPIETDDDPYDED